MEAPILAPENKFNSAEEELAYLRERIATKEKELVKSREEFTREEVVKAQIKEHKGQEPQDVLAKGYSMIEPHVDAIVLNLAPEPHDEKMAELIHLLQEKGILNALRVVEKMNNAHLED